MSNEHFLENICKKVINLETESIEDAVKKALDTGLDPVEIIEKGLAKGAAIMGDRFEKGEAILTELILAAEAMKVGIEVLKPEMLRGNLKRKSLGRVILGTVQGDIHDIGKRIIAVMLEAAGFEVTDLGVDVSPQKFIQKLEEIRPNILGMSALLTTTALEQKTVMEELKKANLRDKVQVIVGGAAVTPDWAAEIGADGYADNSGDAVKIVKKLVGVEGE